MFKLVKILGGRINQPETRTLPVSALDHGIDEGTPVRIVGSDVILMNDTSTDFIPTHIVERNAEEGAMEVIVSDILPGMIFETTLVSTPSSVPKYYVEYPVYGSWVKCNKAVESGVRGAICYDPLGATKQGDKLLVTFPIR